jgi:hypothetical protein
MESAFRQNASNAKTKQRFSGLFGEMKLPQLLLIMVRY